jgi:type VII secretion protein EccB
VVQTKKEQVRAHNYVARRLSRAVLTGAPDGFDEPMRRTSIGTVVGMALAVVIALGFLVYGLIRPAGGPALNSGTTVVVEKETGTRYLVDNGTLRPVSNLASAMLALGGPDLVIQQLTAERTGTLPRGPGLGIPGAPDDVPRADRLAQSGWSACTDAGTSVTGTAPRLRLGFGGPPATPLDERSGLLVDSADGSAYLVTAGRRHPFASPEARAALGYADREPLRVPDAWLAGLAPGRALTTLDVTAVGEPGANVGGRQLPVGTILQVSSPTAEPQNFLVQRDALVTLTEVEQLELLANPQVARVNAAAGGPTRVALDAVVGAVRRPNGNTSDWPSRPPRPVETSGKQVCVVADGAGTTGVEVRPAAEPRPDEPPVSVTLPPGSAALVEPVDPVGGGTNQVSLVDDLGRRYGIADADALAALGLDAVRPVPVPSGLLAVIPAGPVLSTAAAGGAG